MRLALISDIHANRQALEAVLADIDRQNVDAMACLGDIVGYGADPIACIDLIQDRAPVAVVQGNHDEYVAGERSLADINPVAGLATLWTRQQLDEARRHWLASLPLTARVGDDIELVHASLLDAAGWMYVRFLDDGVLTMAAQKARFCFYGHTHRPMAFRQRDAGVEHLQDSHYDVETGDRWLVNVGSVGQPRDGDWRAAWTLLDTDAGTITLHRVEYDLEECMARILAAELPERLARRLALGQ